MIEQGGVKGCVFGLRGLKPVVAVKSAGNEPVWQDLGYMQRQRRLVVVDQVPRVSPEL
ncbi:MAG: hypothetical protein ACOC0W_00815 [Desulfosalsimonas sp.]